MKRFKLILIALLVAMLACSTLTGGGEDNNATAEDNTRLNQPGTADGNSTAAGENSAEENSAEPAPGEAPEDQSRTMVESQIATDSQCYNAFYPVNQERVWTYQTNMSGGDTTQFTIATTNVTDDTITSTMTFPEFSSTVHWNCGPDGLFSSEFAQFNFAMMPGVDIETISYDGLTLPDASLWEVGYGWDSSYQINIAMEFEGLALNTTVTASMNSTVTAIEEVTVPAGTFPEAYRVSVDGTIDFEMLGQTIQAPINSTTWYVKNVGMVKSVSTDDFNDTTLELISIE